MKMINEEYKEIIRSTIDDYEEYLSKDDFDAFFKNVDVDLIRPYSYMFEEMFKSDNKNFLDYISFLPSYFYLDDTSHDILVLPSNIKRINAFALKNSKIKEIIIESTSITIATNALSEANYLQKIRIPKNCALTMQQNACKSGNQIIIEKY